jgi:hypothetical protein
MLKTCCLFTIAGRVIPKSVMTIAITILCHAIAISAHNTVDVKIIAINDLHGQMTAGQKFSNRPVGGAAVLASYLESAQKGWENGCTLVDVGDLVGASEAESALLGDPRIGTEDELTVIFPEDATPLNDHIGAWKRDNGNGRYRVARGSKKEIQGLRKVTFKFSGKSLRRLSGASKPG